MTPRQPLVIIDDLTIYHALDLKEQLLAALAQTGELELNLAQVQAMDSAGLQLLVMLKKEAQRNGKYVRIVAHSQAVSEVIEFCNMAAEFGDPLVIPAHETP